MFLRVVGAGKEHQVHFPLDEMVRALMHANKNSTNFAEFNERPLDEQLQFLNVDTTDITGMVLLARKLHPATRASVGYTRHESHDCGLSSGDSMIIRSSYFIVGEQRLHLAADYCGNTVYLRPKINAQGGVYVDTLQILPSFSSISSKIERGEVQIPVSMSEGVYRPHKEFVNGVMPVLVLKHHNKIDKKYFRMIEKKLAAKAR